MDDKELIALVLRAREGDRVAFGELVERFQSTVYAVALARLRNPTEAQELTQEVFLHGMRKLPQLRDVACFPGWLRQITVRMAINRLTRHGPLARLDSEALEQTESVGVTPLDEMVRAEDREELWKGLEKLKASDRATLVAFYIHGRSLKQMAREFDTPIGTIKRRLHVARNRLKEALEQAGDAPATERRHRKRRELACV
jgi:RNA polymerase sigma-70 factor (ECF subfamily)